MDPCDNPYFTKALSEKSPFKWYPLSAVLQVWPSYIPYIKEWRASIPQLIKRHNIVMRKIDSHEKLQSCRLKNCGVFTLNTQTHRQIKAF